MATDSSSEVYTTPQDVRARLADITFTGEGEKLEIHIGGASISLLDLLETKLPLKWRLYCKFEGGSVVEEIRIFRQGESSFTMARDQVPSSPGYIRVLRTVPGRNSNGTLGYILQWADISLDGEEITVHEEVFQRPFWPLIRCLGSIFLALGGFALVCYLLGMLR